MTKKSKKPTTAERLKLIESQFFIINQKLNDVLQENKSLKTALKMVGDKQECVVELLKEKKTINQKNIDKKNNELKEKELEQKIKGYLKEGILAKAEKVSENSFLICDNLKDKVKQRFVMLNYTEEFRKKFVGKKVNGTVTLDYKDKEGSVKFKILEIYDFTTKTAE